MLHPAWEKNLLDHLLPRSRRCCGFRTGLLRQSVEPEIGFQKLAERVVVVVRSADHADAVELDARLDRERNIAAEHLIPIDVAHARTRELKSWAGPLPETQLGSADRAMTDD